MGPAPGWYEAARGVDHGQQACRAVAVPLGVHGGVGHLHRLHWLSRDALGGLQDARERQAEDDQQDHQRECE